MSGVRFKRDTILLLLVSHILARAPSVLQALLVLEEKFVTKVIEESHCVSHGGKNTLHLQPYRLFGFCLDCYTETQNSLDRSKLRPSQTPTNHPSEFFGHITFSVPNIKL